MAYRIGGPQFSTALNFGLTWGSMRYPLAWRNTRGRTTVFSRTYRVTTGDDYPKFFIWDSGSLFRAEPPTLHPIDVYLPSYTLLSIDDEENPDGDWDQIVFGVGMFNVSTVTVDNQDFDELVGEAIDTDIGTYTIAPEAHTTYQLLQEDVPVQPLGVIDITGLTAI